GGRAPWTKDPLRAAAVVNTAANVCTNGGQRMKPRADVVTAVVAAGYLLRRAGRRSGASNTEVAAALPGDELVPDPMWESTRAITIDAPPEEVWPWIVQMGFPSNRAGWYTPHWLDRLTFGIKQPSADEIRADLQHLEPGDRVP